MKNSKGKLTVMMFASILSFLLMSLSFVLMSVIDTQTVTGFVKYLPGIMFWLFLIVGAVLHIMMAAVRRSMVSRGRIKRSGLQWGIGLIRFFRNRGAIIADIVFVICLIGFILGYILTDGTGTICFVLLPLVVFSFAMHCTLNGKNFNFLINK